MATAALEQTRGALDQGSRVTSTFVDLLLICHPLVRLLPDLEGGEGAGQRAVAQQGGTLLCRDTPDRPYLLEDAAHHLHGGIVSRDLHVHLQGLLQDLAHDLRLDERVVLGEVAVQLLHLVLQALDLCLQHLRGTGVNCRMSSTFSSHPVLAGPVLPTR